MPGSATAAFEAIKIGTPLVASVGVVAAVTEAVTSTTIAAVGSGVATGATVVATGPVIVVALVSTVVVSAWLGLI